MFTYIKVLDVWTDSQNQVLWKIDQNISQSVNFVYIAAKDDWGFAKILHPNILNLGLSCACDKEQFEIYKQETLNSQHLIINAENIDLFTIDDLRYKRDCLIHLLDLLPGSLLVEDSLKLYRIT